MNGQVDIHHYADPLLLADALAAALEQHLSTALAARGRASLVVSGGRTPVPLFERLRGLALDWSRVFITLADERWVESSDAASNERMVRAVLLRERAAAARFIGLKNSAASPALGAALAWQQLAVIPRPFDAVLLGMGDDGHTASLFPQSPGIEQALDPTAAPACVALTAPVGPAARVSLNLAALVQTRQLFLHFTGAAKWQVWQRAADLPAGLTLRRSASRPQLYWSA